MTAGGERLMAADIQPYDPGLPDLHPDSAQWSHEDFVAAWEANDNRFAWSRAFLAAAYSGAHGDLQRYADAVRIGYQTMRKYRSVLKAYAKCSDVGTFTFGVAEALMAQKDRLELVQREQPWSVEEARLLVQSRRVVSRPKVVQARAEPVKPPVSADHTPNARNRAEDSEPPNLPSSVTLPAPVQETAPQVPATVTADEETASQDKPHVHAYKMRCECGQEDKAFSADFGKLEALAEKKYRQELAGLRAEVERLQDENAGLRRSAPADSPESDDPGGGTQETESAADSDVCAGCGGPGVLVWLLQRNGTRGTDYACDRCLAKAREKHPDVVFSREELLGVSA
jgi:hypothetical protein